MHSSRSQDALIRAYDQAGNGIEHKQGRLRRVVSGATREKKSRHAVKHDGSLPPAVDRL
jgi:hypothetical protein